MVVGLSGAYASEWSIMSMYLLLILVVSFRAAWAVRQEEHPGGMTCRRTACADFHRADALSWLVFATVPFWIERVGLYQYLGVEILIWATYALAYNLVLGHSGLPSFGHGAFFGLGAYAFGLAQLNLVANLWLLTLATLVASVGGAIVALFISHRRGIYYALMTIAFGQVFLVHRHQGAQHHGRRGRAAQDRAAADQSSA